MQEQFAFRKTLRKVAAVGTSVAMLGMTLTGALAQDHTLADYPSPFTANTVVVVGSAADPADNTAAADITFGLGAASGSASSSSSAQDMSMPQAPLQWNTGREENLPLNRSLIDGTDGFRANLTDSSIEGLKRSSIHINIGDVDDDYNFHEEFRLTSNARVETGLTYDGDRSEDWKERVFVPMGTSSLGYYYVFDESLRTGNYIANATQTDPIDINFLGKNLELIGIANDADSVTLNVGEKFRLNAGDCVQAIGSEGSVKVCLRGTSTGNKAEIDIGGDVEVISQDTSRTRKGVEVRVEDVFNEDGTSLDSATLFVGKDARKTYNDAQEFIGENKDDPIWVWDLAGLTGASPTLGILLNLNIDNPSETDNPLVRHPLYEGEYMCLPWNYACIIFEKVEQKDDDFATYTLSDTRGDLYFSTADSDAGHVNVSNAAYEVWKANGQNNHGFVAGGVDTDTIGISTNNGTDSTGSQGLRLFRKAQDSSKMIQFYNGTGTANDFENMFQIDYKSSNLHVNLVNYSSFGVAGTLAQIQRFTLGVPDAIGVANLTMFLRESANGEITYFGHSDGDTTQGNDLTYNTTRRSFDISGWKENTRMANGIIIEDPDADASSDKVVIRVPTDVSDYKIDIRAAQPKGIGAPTSTLLRGAAAPITGVASKVDTEVLDGLQTWNVISVGGPAINEVSAKLKGLTFPAYGAASGINPGEAVIELMKNGNNWALIAAGYDKENTRAAGLVLRHHGDYADKLKGTSVVVKGVEATGITVA